MTSKLAEEIAHDRDLTRYASRTDHDAVNLAHKDLLSAPDTLHSPPVVCKMFATDVLLEAAMCAPALITDTIIKDCQRVFSECNDYSRLNIVRILRELRRKDAAPFLEQVRDDRTRPNAVQTVLEDGRPIMKSFRDDSLPDLVADAAVEALSVIRNDVA